MTTPLHDLLAKVPFQPSNPHQKALQPWAKAITDLVEPPVPVPPASPYTKLIFEDSFEGAQADLSRWNVWDNWQLDYDIATTKRANAVVSGGKLHLQAKREAANGRQFTTAYLDTRNGKFSFMYGRMEAMIAAPYLADPTNGLWGAFWTRSDAGNGEIDTTELPSVKGARSSTQGIFNGYSPVIKQDNTDVSTVPLTDFQLYAVEWDPDSIRWYLGGRLIWERTPATTPWFADCFRKPHHLRLNLQCGGWVGTPAATATFPTEMTVDYVRVLQRP